jgi:dipeptidyl aminopeptidase/acylaminoacyl peptidase
VWPSRGAAESARPFTSGAAEDKAPRFGPDGSLLYFLSDREERKNAQLYRVRLDGGEAERLTEGKPGIAAYAPLADGTRVVLLSGDAPSEEDERRERERDDASVFGDWKPQRLRLLDLEAHETQTLGAPGERHVRSVVPSPVGSLAAVVLWETPEIDNIGRPGELRWSTSPPTRSWRAGRWSRQARAPPGRETVGSVSSARSRRAGRQGSACSSSGSTRRRCGW